MEVSCQLHDPAALPQRKSPWYPLDRRLGRPQDKSGCGGEDKNSQNLPGIEPCSSSLQPNHYIKLLQLCPVMDMKIKSRYYIWSPTMR